jgi:hypothetical protein
MGKIIRKKWDFQVRESFFYGRQNKFFRLSHCVLFILPSRIFLFISDRRNVIDQWVRSWFNLETPKAGGSNLHMVFGLIQRKFSITGKNFKIYVPLPWYSKSYSSDTHLTRFEKEQYYLR